MRTIHRFALTADSVTTIHVPRGAKLLSIQAVGDETFGYTPTAWFLVDPTAFPEPRRFHCLLTGTRHGNDYLHNLRYITTLVTFRGAYVLHYFEEAS